MNRGSENLARSFCRFAWRLHERLSQERLHEEEKTLLFEVIEALFVSMDAGEVCLDLHCVKTQATIAEMESVLWRSKLASSNQANDILFVLDEAKRLYLHRFFHYEVTIAERFKYLMTKTSEQESRDFHLSRLFPAFESEGSKDFQALAVAVAQMSPLSIISGGPGTGKTWTVVKILEALLLTNPKLRIAMCAPTGKAAARMGESVRNNLQGVDESVRHRIPTMASTVHRLIKQHRPLAYDVIVLDEASMVSLALMAELIEATAESTRLILLGDKDQLASVEPGAVFAELSQTFAFSPQKKEKLQALGFDSSVIKAANADCRSEQRWDLTDHTVWLTRSYRFDDQKGIGRLARYVREGNAQEAIDKLFEDDELVRFMSLKPTSERLPDSVRDVVLRAYQPYFEAVRRYFDHRAQLSEVFAALHRFGLLCAVNEGAFGIDTFNELIVASLSADWGVHVEEHFPGEVIMVSVNDRDLQLNNGDVGVVLREADGRLMAYFETVDEMGSEGFRSIPVGRLPENKRAFALTIHKSQGSEFDNVMLVLPTMSQLLTRELLYTGVTRAKKSLTVVATSEAIRRAISTPTNRLSGLFSR